MNTAISTNAGSGSVGRTGGKPEPEPVHPSPSAMLDAQVAERVLGWRDLVWVGDGWGREVITIDDKGRERRHTHRGWFGYPPDAAADATPSLMAWHLSHEVNTSRIVVRAMAKLGFRLDLSFSIDADGDVDDVDATFYHAQDVDERRRPRTGRAMSPNEAKAICLAALQALDAPFECYFHEMPIPDRNGLDLPAQSEV